MGSKTIIRILLTCLLVLSFTPNMLSMTILEKSYAQPTTPEQEKGVVLFLGDSLTAGYRVSPEDSYPHLIGEKIAKIDPKLRIVNAGVSGDTTAGGLARLNWLLRQDVEILVLALGANDGLRGLPVVETKRNLLKIVETTKKKFPNTSIVLAGMLIPPNMGESYTTEFKQIFPDLAREQRLALIPFLLEGVAADPTLNQADGIHPNEQGYKIVAENVWQVLEKLVNKEERK